VHGLAKKDQFSFHSFFRFFVLFFTVLFDDDAPLCFSVTEIGGGEGVSIARLAFSIQKHCGEGSRFLPFV
jgi:hypothetical protein